MSEPTILSADTNGPSRARIAAAAFSIALALAFVARISHRQFPDPDMYHGMALGRLVLERWEVPHGELFAYTPAVEVSVHHEWAYGVAMHLLVERTGAGGLLGLRYALAAGIAGLCVWTAVRRGAAWVSIVVVAPIAIHLVGSGITTVRAQVFTLFMLAVLLRLLDVDRAGKTWWILLWLPLHAVWINLHAGFVVGLVLLGAHWLERVATERKVHWHLIGTGLAAGAMVPLVNPYGWEYLPALLYGLTMDRSQITEWRPVWTAGALNTFVFAFPLVLVVYALARRGWRELPGLLIVALTAYAAVRHQRHVTLFAVVLLAYVPSYLRGTPLERILDGAWRKRPTFVLGAAVVLAVACIVGMRAPWRLHLAVTSDDPIKFPLMPYGPVGYLREIGFRGNVMPPFHAGAFVIYHLWPGVKVGTDGRYEVAYQPGVTEEIFAMYRGAEGWRETLGKHPTDVLLVTHDRPLAKLVAEETDWQLVYRDDDWGVYARPGLDLPVVDRSGEAAFGHFP